ncbi:MAG: hypothetical protein WC527_07450 [Candidatus Margulisiibacteriota bacterium]
MLKKMLILIAFASCMFLAFQAGVISKNDNAAFTAFDIPVKKLFAEPDDKSPVVYDVPVNINLTGATIDNEWYRVKVSYSFLGYFEYEGWCKVR